MLAECAEDPIGLAITSLAPCCVQHPHMTGMIFTMRMFCERYESLRYGIFCQHPYLKDDYRWHSPLWAEETLEKFVEFLTKKLKEDPQILGGHGDRCEVCWCHAQVSNMVITAMVMGEPFFAHIEKFAAENAPEFTKMLPCASKVSSRRGFVDMRPT